jgi:hypothetical protein
MLPAELVCVGECSYRNTLRPYLFDGAPQMARIWLDDPLAGFLEWRLPVRVKSSAPADTGGACAVRFENDERKSMKTRLMISLLAAGFLMAACSPGYDEAQHTPSAQPDPEPPYAPGETDVGYLPAEPQPAPDGIQIGQVPSEVMAESSAYVMAMVDRRVDEVDARLESVTDSVQRLEETQQEQVQPVLATLQEQREELEVLAEQMRQATGHALNQLQNQFEAVYQALLSTLEATEELLAG